MGKPSAILLCSKPGAAVALSILVERGWDVRAVVPSALSRQSWIAGETAVDLARDHGIPIVERQSDLHGLPKADFVISYMYRYLVKPATLDLADRAAVNFHAGPLPEFGGWAFYNIAILEDADSYGCTCHHMDDGFDTGDLVHVRRFPINASEETAVSLERRSQQEMIKLFADFCELAESGQEIPKIPQDQSRHRYMKQEEFQALKRIPADSDDEQVQRYARAFWYPPFECAYIEMENAKAEVVPDCVKTELATFHHIGDLDDLRQVAASYQPSISWALDSQ